MNIFNKKPFLIAEIGVNFHDIAEKDNISDMEAAKLMIREAKNCGIDAVNFQSYNAEIFGDSSAHDYLKEYRELAEYCSELDILFLSTPCDFESADYLGEFMDVYKISSCDITNIPFIQYIAGKNKPILLSTGASTLNEIKDAVSAIEDVSTADIAIMHSVLSYPTAYEDANLAMIKDLAKHFQGYEIGYSDYTKPDGEMMILSTAYCYGATILEKYFTLDKKLSGNDQNHAMDPDDVRIFRKNMSFLSKISGHKNKQLLICETSARRELRKSIVASQDIKKGSKITHNNITFKRPGTGISPSMLDEIIGKVAKENISESTLIDFEMLE